MSNLESNSLTVIGPTQLPALEISAVINDEIARLLAVPALMSKCNTQAENKAVFEARRDIESMSRTLEKARKRITDPINDKLREYKAIVDAAREPLDREAGRLALLEKDFKLAEDRRIREAEEAQRRELERIEREKQAEIQRLAREQAEREAAARRAQEETERKAREAQAAAERAEREAKGKKEREAAAEQRRIAAAQAEAARVERERLESKAAAERQRNAAAMIETQRLADEAALIAGRPVDRIRETGQTARKVWKITQVNDFVLIKSRPDLVRKIEWDMVALKQALDDNNGKLPGVTAEEDYSMGARGGRKPSFIEV